MASATAVRRRVIACRVGEGIGGDFAASVAGRTGLVGPFSLGTNHAAPLALRTRHQLACSSLFAHLPVTYLASTRLAACRNRCAPSQRAPVTRLVWTGSVLLQPLRHAGRQDLLRR